MKQLILILVLWVCATSAMAQEMRSIFVNLPDSIEPLLTKVNREDCIDFLDSDMKALVKNRFDRTAELKELTKDYLQMQLTDVSTFEMKLLPLKDSVMVIGLIKTVCSSACDSHIRFFDTSWNELGTAEFFRLPSEDLFYLPKDSVGDDFDELRSEADVYLTKLAFSSNNSTLTVTYTTPDYLNNDNREKLAPYLKNQPIVMDWEEGRFVLK